MSIHAIHVFVADIVLCIHRRMHDLKRYVEQGRRLNDIEHQTLLEHDAAMQRLYASNSTAEIVDGFQAVVDNVFKSLYVDGCVRRKHSKVEDAQRRSDDNRYTSLTCTTCERQFSSRRRLKEHALIHQPYSSRRYKCTECPKRFLSSSHLAFHKRTCCQR